MGLLTSPTKATLPKQLKWAGVAVSLKEIDGTEAQEEVPALKTGVWLGGGAGVELWLAIPVPLREMENIYHSHIVHVGHSLMAIKISW